VVQRLQAHTGNENAAAREKAKVHIAYAKSMLARNQNKAAIDELRRGLSLLPSDSDDRDSKDLLFAIHSTLGDCEAKDDKRNAIASYRVALKYKEDTKTRASLAFLLGSTHDLDFVDEYRKVLEAEPGNIKYRCNYIWCLELTGNHKEAIGRFKELAADRAIDVRDLGPAIHLVENVAEEYEKDNLRAVNDYRTTLRDARPELTTGTAIAVQVVGRGAIVEYEPNVDIRFVAGRAVLEILGFAWALPVHAFFIIMSGIFLAYPIIFVSVPDSYYVYLNWYYGLFGSLFVLVYWFMGQQIRNRIMEWFVILAFFEFITVLLLTWAAGNPLLKVLYLPNLLIYFCGIFVMQYRTILGAVAGVGDALGGVYIRRRQVYAWTARFAYGFAYIDAIWYLPLTFLWSYFSYDATSRAIYWLHVLFLANCFYWSKFAQAFRYRKLREEQVIIGAAIYLLVLAIIVGSGLDPLQLLARNVLLTMLMLLMFYDTAVMRFESALRYGGYVILLVGIANISGVFRMYIDEIVTAPWLRQVVAGWYSLIPAQDIIVSLLSLALAVLSYIETRKQSKALRPVVMDRSEYEIT